MRSRAGRSTQGGGGALSAGTHGTHNQMLESDSVGLDAIVDRFTLDRVQLFMVSVALYQSHPWNACIPIVS